MDNKCSYFPLRWESTGDQWWYASPIDWAAADGHYDIVRQLLHLDPNLLIKLTSLRRIRRLEALWDDDARFAGASRHRAAVARSLLLECECKAGAGAENTLLRAGYGGWLLYSAASAGDMGFVRELLERDALLVFGEGEYGVTDMLYAAARGGDAGVFRLLLDHAMSPRCSTNCRDGEGAGAGGGRASVFRLEMMSRALHAAARGGSVEILRELVDGRSGVSEHLDARGSTVLHAAAGRGQLEVAKYLMAAFDIINSTDNQGNTALHVAAYRGHLPVVEALVAASPSTLSSVNHAGDTFLHTAVAGFRTPGFRRLDRQMELMRYLVRERTTDIQKIINLKNDAGLTALHMAVVGCVHPDLVALLMTTPSIDLNAEDGNGMTPLALLKQQLRSTTSERLIKQIVSAGGVLNSSVLRTRSAIVSQIRMQGGIASSPGTTFKISDAEIFLFSGIGAAESRRPSSCSSSGKCDAACEDANGVNGENHGSSEKRLSSASRAKDRLKMMLRWPRHKDKMSRMLRKSEDGNPLDSIKKLREQVVETPAPLRQTFTKTTALNNKRTLAVKSSTPSSATKKKLNTKLIHGIMESMPHLASSTRSPATTLPRSSMSSTPPSGKLKGICLEDDEDYSTTAPISFKLKDVVLDNTLDEPSCSTWSTYEDGSVTENPARKHGCGNGRLINICFGAQGLTVEDSANGQQTSKMFKQQCLRVS